MTALASPAKFVAPHVDPPAAASHYRLCVRCIMDTSDPGISFAEDGTCSHCNGYFSRAARDLLPPDAAEQQLRALVSAIQSEGKGRDYDCVIGVSGGVDSTYVAYQVKRLGLRPLAVHFDNGWNSELAVDNIKRTLDALQIDLQTCVVDWEEFRDIQLSFLKASVPNCEIPTDHAITALLYRTAAQIKSRFILTGSNVVTEAIMPFAWGYYGQDLRHLRAIHKRFGTLPIRTLPRLSLAQFLTAVLVRRIRYVPILNLLPYDKSDAKRLIENKLGWRDYGGKHYESIYTRFFQGYILPRKFGFDKRRAHFSTMICSGQISRDSALAEMTRSPYGDLDPEQDREFVVKKLGISDAIFEGIMRAPPRKHLEFPSNQFLFHRSTKWKQWFKRIATQGA